MCVVLVLYCCHSQASSLADSAPFISTMCGKLEPAVGLLMLPWISCTAGRTMVRRVSWTMLISPVRADWGRLAPAWRSWM